MFDTGLLKSLILLRIFLKERFNFSSVDIIFPSRSSLNDEAANFMNFYFSQLLLQITTT